MNAPRLRTGRNVRQHLYWQDGDTPADTDPPIATVPSVALASAIVRATALAWPDGLPPHLRPTGPDVTPPP